MKFFRASRRERSNGYHGAELFIREDGDEVEFVTLLRFDSMDAVKEFAGADESKPVIFPKAERSSREWSGAALSRRDLVERIAGNALLRRRRGAFGDIAIADAVHWQAERLPYN